MRLSTQIRRRRVSLNANVEKQQENLLVMLEEQQQKTYENLRLHFTGLAFQGLNAGPNVRNGARCIELSIQRGKDMADAWVDSV